MSMVLFVLAGICFLFSVVSFKISDTSVHEIFATLVALIGAVLLSGAFVVESIQQLKKALTKPE